MNRRPTRNPAPRAPDPLRDAANEILTDARRQFNDLGNDGATAVHEFRKAMKRWRAMLRLYEPLVGDEATQLRIEARDLARELAGTRDARSALDALTDEVRQSIREALEHAAKAAHRWPLDDVAFTAVADGLAASYARARRAVPGDWTTASEDELHTLRQRVVVHRYQMDLAVPLWPKIGRAWVAEAQKLRDRLGHHQDLAVLRAFTAPHKPLAPWRSRLLPLIAARQAEHAAAARRIAGRLLAEKPKAFRRRMLSLWDSRREQ